MKPENMLKKLTNVLAKLPEQFTIDNMIEIGYGRGSGQVTIRKLVEANLATLTTRRYKDKYLYAKVVENVQEVPPSERSQTVNSVLGFVSEFEKLTNTEKAHVSATLFPMVSGTDLLVKFEELYPSGALADVNEGDILFHPMLGHVTIAKASTRKLSFYGNGAEWICNRDGYFIENNGDAKKKILFKDFADYAKFMGK